MLKSLILLFAIAGFYAGYNLLVKIASSHVPAEATSTILATISLQLAALAVSTCFALSLLIRGGHVLSLSGPAYAWAVGAGLCIGAAEIGYFYLFRGVGGVDPMAANVAIPSIIGGSIAIALLVSYLLLREPLTWLQLLGTALVVCGVITIFLGSSSYTQPA